MAGGRALGDGDPGERHHVPLNPRPGLCRRPALRAVLLRPAARHDRDLRDRDPHLPAAARVHRLRVPGAALRRQDAHARSGPLPGAARPRGRAHPLRAGARALCDPRLGRALDLRAARRARRGLHRQRRQQGGRPHPRAAVPDHHRHDARGVRDRGRFAPEGRGAPGRRAGRGRAPSAERDRRALRSEEPLHAVVRADRWVLPPALVLRHRPVAGRALPHRALGGREPHGARVQRPRQDPDAVRHPLPRGHGVRVPPVRVPAAVLRSGRGRPGGERSEWRGLPRARGAPPRCVRRATERDRGAAARRSRGGRGSCGGGRGRRPRRSGADRAGARRDRRAAEALGPRREHQRHELHLPALRAGPPAGRAHRPRVRGRVRRLDELELGRAQRPRIDHHGGRAQAPARPAVDRPLRPHRFADRHAVLGRIRRGVRRLREPARHAGGGREHRGIALLRHHPRHLPRRVLPEARGRHRRVRRGAAGRRGRDRVLQAHSHRLPLVQPDWMRTGVGLRAGAGRVLAAGGG